MAKRRIPKNLVLDSSEKPEIKIGPNTRWVTVDPGVGGTGIVFWIGRRYIRLLEVVPKSGKKEWIQVWGSMVQVSQANILDFNPNYLFVEEPFHKDGPEARTGSVVKLALLAGAILGVGYKIEHELELAFIPVRTWKGQLPKGISNERLRMRDVNMRHVKSTHILDAVAIGYWILDNNPAEKEGF